MKRMAWCALIVIVAVVAGCSAPPSEDQGAADDSNATAVESGTDEAVVEEGFESGETGSLEPGESTPDDEAAASQ